MSGGEKGFFLTAFGLVGLTGLGLLGLYGLPEPEDPFLLVRHPLEPWLRTVHVLTAPILVFAVGILWRSHIRPHLRYAHRNRLSGWSVLLGFTASGISGYLFQVATGEAVRSAAWYMHVVSSVFFLAAVVGHWVAARWVARTARRKLDKQAVKAA